MDVMIIIDADHDCGGNTTADYYRIDGNDLILDLKIQPGASASEFAGRLGARLKIRLKAPPREGKANVELIRFLAGCLDVPRSAITIERGVTSRSKRVRIRNGALEGTGRLP